MINTSQKEENKDKQRTEIIQQNNQKRKKEKITKLDKNNKKTLFFLL